MNKSISIKKMSRLSLAVTAILSLFIVLVSYFGWYEFRELVDATKQYTDCRSAAARMEDASENLTEQVRLYAMTGDRSYMDSYFEEAKVQKNRDVAVADIEKYFGGTEVFRHLNEALAKSVKLMEIEYYSMRLVSEANGIRLEELPKEIMQVELEPEDEALSPEGKLEKGRSILFDESYEKSRQDIIVSVKECTESLIDDTDRALNESRHAFMDIYWKLIVAAILFCISSIVIIIMIGDLVVVPLVHYNECILSGIIFPVEGAAELQTLAETYNEVFLENLENQKLIKHQADHDGLTEILNRRSFERLLRIHENEDSPFALFIVDVDQFKNFNDKYGHHVGDMVLKKVAKHLKSTFRSTDYVCRIGGDEFAVIMVEMPSELRYVAVDKIAQLTKSLKESTVDDYHEVTLSIGVAFSDNTDEETSVFAAADEALYDVKENGRNGYRFYGDERQA